MGGLATRTIGRVGRMPETSSAARPYHRVTIFNKTIIEGSADVAWRHLTDWGRSKAKPPASDSKSAIGITAITLEGGENDLPRTRVLHFADRPELRETLLSQDDEARLLIYNIEGIGPHGLRNYLATTEIDALAGNQFLINITARFDVPPDGDVLAAKTFIDTAHHIVFSGVAYQCSSSDPVT